MAGQVDEDSVIAYLTESLHTGLYHSAVSTIPKNFFETELMTYRSSPYLGRLEGAFRNLEQEENERISKILRFIKERSLDLFLEDRWVPFLYASAPLILQEDIPLLVRSVDIVHINPDMGMRLLEAWIDWGELFPRSENPFDRFLDQSEHLLTRLIKPIKGERRLPVINNRVDIVQALRLYAILSKYTRGEDDIWPLVGETVLLSALSLVFDDEALPATVYVQENGSFERGSEKVSAAKAYMLINGGDRIPHQKAFMGDYKNPIRIWTAAATANVRLDARGVSLAFPFAASESHYAIVRGIKPFKRLLFSGKEVAGSSRFERSDGSAWFYMSQEQTLLLKLKSPRTTEEVRVVYVEDRPPPVQKESPETKDARAEERDGDQSKDEKPSESHGGRLPADIPPEFRNIPRPPGMWQP